MTLDGYPYPRQTVDEQPRLYRRGASDALDELSDAQLARCGQAAARRHDAVEHLGEQIALCVGQDSLRVGHASASPVFTSPHFA